MPVAACNLKIEATVYELPVIVEDPLAYKVLLVSPKLICLAANVP